MRAPTFIFAAGLLVGACGSPEPLPANPDPIEASASSGGDLDSLFEEEGIEPESSDDDSLDDAATDDASPEVD